VGLPRGSRRRTGGLRREEVAALAGMSVDYYSRIEQQRGPMPSEQVLAALARGLHLSLSERDYLFDLAGHPAPRRVLREDHVSPTMMRIVERLSDTPALVMSRFGETLLQTRPAVALLGDYTRFNGLSRYLVYRWFTDPAQRDLYPDEDHALRGRVCENEQLKEGMHMPCASTSGRTSLTPRLMVMAVVLKSCQKSRSSTAEDIGRLTSKERYSFGAQFAEVAVDVTTGEVRVRRMLGMFAAGRIVNPLTARSQFAGGMVWGLSMALYEEAARDQATGGHVGADLAGYHFAANADVPVIEADWVDDPVGIKGIGEIGIVGAAAAIANAVWHATGVRHRHLPIRPDRVLMAGRDA
uniref:helix-turn-helix transcriptional regulator n=1 Tax=Streptomyces yerevanensis TaxID=66378 RepID=UPI001FE06799